MALRLWIESFASDHVQQFDSLPNRDLPAVAADFINFGNTRSR